MRKYVDCLIFEWLILRGYMQEREKLKQLAILGSLSPRWRSIMCAGKSWLREDRRKFKILDISKAFCDLVPASLFGPFCSIGVFVCFETGSLYVAEAVLELTI